MHTSVRKQQHLKDDALLYRQPVESLENGCDMFITFGASHQPSCSVLDPLEAFDEGLWKSVQYAVAIVQTGTYEGMHQLLSDRLSQKVPDIA